MVCIGREASRFASSPHTNTTTASPLQKGILRMHFLNSEYERSKTP